MSEVLLDLESRPGHPKSVRLTMTADGLTIKDVSFGWAEISRVGYHATDIHVGGAYMGAVFGLRVGTATASAAFQLDSRTTGVVKINKNYLERDHHQAQWTKAVEILEEKVCGRLAGAAVAAVQQGGTAEIGGLRLDLEGVHKGGILSKSVVWRDIAGINKQDGYHVLLVRRGGKDKPALKVSAGEWNGVLLPRVIAVLASIIGPQSQS